MDTLNQITTQIKREIDEADDENAKIEKEVASLSAHNEVNKPLKKEREELILKVQELALNQNELYTENIK